MVEFLKERGVLQGNKLKQGLDMPRWILDEPEYRIACLRGIFDTDGCIFQERHNIKDKIYSYPRLSFVSASEALRGSISTSLLDLGFKAKIRGNRSVNLERFEDITEYFRIVSTSNPKHLRRFHSFGGIA